MRRIVPTLLAPVLLAPVLLTLGACAVGPDYQRPATPAVMAFSETAQASAVTTTAPPDHWWRLYNDPVLDRLVGEALAHNTDVRVAAANLQRARAVLSEQRDARLPTTTPSASATYARTGAQASPFGAAQERDFYSVGFDAAYEVDLFGGVSRAIAAARGDAGAAAAELDAVRVSIAAETARTYVEACGTAAQRDVALETAGLQRRTVELTQALFDRGRGARRDVERAEVLLAQTQAVVPTFEAERRASLYALATLTGRPAEAIDAEAAACKTTPRLAANLPVGDGAALLARRPDVRAAEQALAADTARVGVATADLYPSIRLLGSIGFGSSVSKETFDHANLSYGFGPLISWSLPNNSAARSRVKGAKAGAEVSLARFDGTVLTALQEVEQALARYQGALERDAALERAQGASVTAADLSQLRFDYGAESFLLLIDAQRDRATAAADLARSRQAVAQAQISLFKALGGGWDGAPAPSRRTAGL